MRSRPFIILIIATLLEAVAVQAFMAGQYLSALALHTISSVAFGIGFLRVLPSPYNGTSWGAFSFGAGLCFFIPVLAPPGLLFGVRWALLNPKKQIFDPYREFEIPELPLKSLYMEETAAPRYSEGALQAVLRLAKDPDKRVDAVMALRQLPDRGAIPILKIALKDPVDDVRLLAYSMIDRKDQEINGRIQNLLVDIETATNPRQQFLIHRSLAQNYWELAYLGIAEGDVRIFSLDAARRNALAAIKIREDVGARYLLGRIALFQGDTEFARESFSKARELGLPEATVLPYLADVAFKEKEYGQVQDFLGAVPSRFLEQGPLAMVGKYWLSPNRRWMQSEQKETES